MDLQKIGACLRELRKEKGLTQEQLAAHFNVSVKTVSRWENGVHMPDIELLLELADFYEVDLRALLRGERVSEKTTPNTKETVQETAEYNKAKTSMRKRIAGEFAYYRTVIKWRIDSLRRKIGHALHRMSFPMKSFLKKMKQGINRVKIPIIIIAALIMIAAAIAAAINDAYIWHGFWITAVFLLLLGICIIGVMLRPTKRTFWVSALVVISFLLYYCIAFTSINAVSVLKRRASEERKNDTPINEVSSYSISEDNSDGRRSYL